jgi:acetoin utilization deacetylase AcuC-like enzyme
MAARTREAAERWGAPLGAVLEGGYDPAAVAESVVATLTALSDGK